MRLARSLRNPWLQKLRVLGVPQRPQLAIVPRSEAARCSACTRRAGRGGVMHSRWGS